MNIEAVIIQKYQNIPHNNITGDLIFLDESHLPSIMALQEIVIKNLRDPVIFEPASIEFIQHCLKTDGKMIGVIIKNQLIAHCAIYFPRHNNNNLGLDLSFPENILDKVAQLEVVAVHPDYRGNLLGLTMSNQALKIMKTFQFHHACVTVSPKNFYNLNVVLKLGFLIKKLALKYDGKLRYILYKNLTVETLSFNPQDGILIPNTDIEAQQNALQQGLVGHQIHPIANGFAIVFNRFHK